MEIWEYCEYYIKFAYYSENPYLSNQKLILTYIKVIAINDRFSAHEKNRQSVITLCRFQTQITHLFVIAAGSLYHTHY